MGKKNKRKKNKNKNYQQNQNQHAQNFNQNQNAQNLNENQNVQNLNQRPQNQDDQKPNQNQNFNNQVNNQDNKINSQEESRDFLENYIDEHMEEQTKVEEDRPVHVAEKIDDDFHDDTKFSRKNVATMLIAILMSIFLTLVILFSTGLLKKDHFSFLPFIEKTGSWQDKGFTFGKESAPGAETADNSSEELVSNFNLQGENQKQVKLPVLMVDNQDMELEGHKLGCDILYWIPIFVSDDENIVSSTIQALFDYDREFDFLVGNYVAKQKNLNFDKVVVDGQDASIYISGEITDLNDACDSIRLETQLSWVALQFDHITKVTIYLNGELYSQTN